MTNFKLQKKDTTVPFHNYLGRPDEKVVNCMPVSLYARMP